MQITTEAKRALLNCLQNAAYADADALTLYNALNNAFFPLTSISAVYTQTETVTAATPLNDLKTDLVVTATYEGGDTEVLADNAYTLSGTLATGTSVITVAYSGLTTTFNVTVSASESYVTNGLIHHWDGINNTGSGHNASSQIWKDLVGNYDLLIHGGNVTWGSDHVQLTSDTASFLYTTENNVEDSANMTAEMVMIPESESAMTVAQLLYKSGKANDAYGKFNVFPDFTWSSQGKSAYTWDSGASALANLKYVASSFASDGTPNKGYANGVEVQLTNKTHSMRYGITRMLVGGSMQSWASTVGYPFVGKIKAIRIYNRNLTAEEIAQNYATDVERFGL